jgi:hypothetical protein
MENVSLDFEMKRLRRLMCGNMLASSVIQDGKVEKRRAEETRESASGRVTAAVLGRGRSVDSWKMRFLSYFFERLQCGDETEDGEETSAGGGQGSSSALEGRSRCGLGRGAGSRGRGGFDGNGAVGRRVGRGWDGGGLMGRLDKSLGGSSRSLDGSLGGLGNDDGGGAAAVVADGDHGRGGGLDDGATWVRVRKGFVADGSEGAILTTRAVGDCESGGLGDGVGLAGVGDLSGLGAVCRVCGDDLGHVRRSGAVLGVLDAAVGSRNASHGGDSEGSSETHFDGISREVVGLLVRLSIKW